MSAKDNIQNCIDSLKGEIASIELEVGRKREQITRLTAQLCSFETSLSFIEEDVADAAPPTPPKSREPRIDVRDACTNLLRQRGPMTAAQLGEQLQRPQSAIRRSLEAPVLAGKLNLALGGRYDVNDAAAKAARDYTAAPAREDLAV